MPSRRYKRAQKATASQLLSVISQSSISELLTSVCYATDLSQEQRDEVFDMFAENMKELYTSCSFGWKPEEKKEELFDKQSRFILLTRHGRLEAYCMFRFDDEDGLDVIYCYELQVHSDARRKGFGRFLVNALLRLATKWKMDRIMLTVIRANETASQFYRAIGFEVDHSSPTFVEEYSDGSEDSNHIIEVNDVDLKESDYEILSMSVEPQNHSRIG